MSKSSQSVFDSFSGSTAVTDMSSLRKMKSIGVWHMAYGIWRMVTKGVEDGHRPLDLRAVTPETDERPFQGSISFAVKI
jgi:hypothetical protein